MKFLKFFRRTNKKEKAADKPKEAALVRRKDVSIGHSDHGGKSLTETLVGPIPFETSNEEVAANFLNKINSGDHAEPGKFFTDDADLMFSEAHMTAPGIKEELWKLFKSFPDFHFIVRGKVKEQPDGSVIVRFNAVGTHTGAPYAFGPYPEVKITGMRVEMDDEEFRFIIRDGKIAKLIITPLGQFTGPPGFYLKIGGIIF